MTTRSTVLALALLSATSALAQEDFLRVYQWETPQQGWVELNLWTTWVVSSGVPYQRYGLQGDRTGAIAHSFEVEYGVTDRLAIGAYTDFDQPPGGGFEFHRARVVARYRLFNRYDYFFDPALYAELYFPRAATGEAQELELRLILEHDFGDFRWDINALLAKALSTEEVGNGLAGSLATGVYWRRFWVAQPGLELFWSFGQIGHSPALSAQSVVLSPSVDIRFGQAWTWHLAAGVGLTEGSDHFLVRSILTFEFPTTRPADQAAP